MVIELHPATVIPTTTPVTLCAACGHDDAAHDATGRRYCAATTSAALSRGCICSGR